MLTQINGVWYEPVTRLEPVPEVGNSERQRCGHFRRGQKDRKEGRGCAEAIGSYLDGWYAPDVAVPPYVTSSQVIAFNL